MLDSEVAVAVAIDEVDEDDIVVEEGEGVIVERMRIEVGTALVVDSVMVGVPDAVRIDVILLGLVVAIELLPVVEEVGGVVELAEVEGTGVWLVVEVLEAALLVGRGVLSKLVSIALLELS